MAELLLLNLGDYNEGDDWIEDRTEMVIDESSSSMFAVAALTISDPEYKYQLLSCPDLKEVFLQLTRFLAEMDV